MLDLGSYVGLRRWLCIIFRSAMICPNPDQAQSCWSQGIHVQNFKEPKMYVRVLWNETRVGRCTQLIQFQKKPKFWRKLKHAETGRTVGDNSGGIVSNAQISKRKRKETEIQIQTSIFQALPSDQPSTWRSARVGRLPIAHQLFADSLTPSQQCSIKLLPSSSATILYNTHHINI